MPFAHARSRRALGLTAGKLLLALAPLLTPSLGNTKPVALDAAPLSDVKLRLDGLLKEWPALAPLSETLSGRADEELEAQGLVGYDAEHLYVALRVKDDKLVRTANPGKGEDHGQLELAFPLRSGGRKIYKLGLYPGVPGQSAGSVTLDGRLLPSAKLVEAKTAEGVSLEAKIPWSALAEAQRVRSGLRGALAYCDADAAGRVSACIGTAKSGNLPPLSIEAEYSLNQSLIFDRGLSRTPSFEVFGNLVGDAMLERLAVHDRYWTVTGWNYRGGKEYFYQDLAVQKSGDLRNLQLVDFDGDGRDEVLLEKRVVQSDSERVFAEVWRFSTDSAPPQSVFLHEIAVSQGKASLTNRLSVVQKQGKPSLLVSQGEVTQLDPDTWTARATGGTTYGALLPWQPLASRRYEWRGAGFEMIEEKPMKPKLSPPKGGTRFYSGPAPKGIAGSEDQGPAANGIGADEPLPHERTAAPPRPPTADELQAQVYDLYLSDRNQRKAKPRFDFVTNVAADPTAERVLVHGTDLVVFGRRFKEGQSYVYTNLGVKADDHILDVTAKDLTGDGRAEILVRAVLEAQASKALGGKLVTRHALYVYRVTEHEMTRIFAAETGRSLEGNTILGHVRFVPRGQVFDIELLPGRALGWTEQSYPFPEDLHPYGGLQPLALPWTKTGARRYAYQGSRYEAR